MSRGSDAADPSPAENNHPPAAENNHPSPAENNHPSPAESNHPPAENYHPSPAENNHPPAAEDSPPSDDAGRGSYGAGLSHGAASFVANTLVALVSSVVVARLYGVSVIGEYALAGAPAGVVWLLSTVREQPALIRRLAVLEPRDPQVTGLFAAVLTFSALLTAAVSLLAGALTWWLLGGPLAHPGLVAPAEVMLGASLVFVNTCWNVDTVLGAFRAGRPLLLCRLHQALVYLILAIALSAAMPSMWGVMVAWYASWATSLLQRGVSVRRFMRLRVRVGVLREGLRTLPELLRFGVRLTPGFVAEGVSDEAGTWILGGLLAPVAAIGAFSRAWMLARRGLELNYRVTEMLLPTLVERRAARDERGYERALMDSLRYVAIAMLLPAAVAAGAAHAIMAIYGPGFASGAGALAYVAFVPGIVTLSAVRSQALIADGHGLRASLYGLARMAATLAAATLLARSYGASGVGAGMLIGACVQLLALSRSMPRTVARGEGEGYGSRTVVPLLAAAVAGFVCARLTADALAHASALLGALLAPSGGAAAAGLVFVLAGGVRERDRVRGRRLRRALGGRVSVSAPEGRPRGSSGTP
jgi:O-antigen/teichoic acid export membrane protein